MLISISCSMAKSQMIAAGIVAILRFGFNTALLIISTPYPTAIGSISNLIVFISACFYMMKIKLCPEVQNHLLLTVIEASVGIVILEFMLGLWSSVECIVSAMTESAFADLVNRNQVVMITDMIIAAMAICIFLTVLIEGKFLQKAVVYYRKQICGAKECAMPSRANKSQPKKTNCSPMSKTQFRDPKCPFHGDGSPQNCK